MKGRDVLISVNAAWKNRTEIVAKATTHSHDSMTLG
ncbi:MAG: hypothetical protein ACI83E_002998, partial [Sulfitobacter sp.]